MNRHPVTLLRAGRYAVYPEFAAGGMASLHFGRLRGSAGFSRIVAIKRMLPNVVRDRELAACFVDEARLASRIHHPNVVVAHDVVHTDDELFLVMDYVHGLSLATLFNAVIAADEPAPLDVAVRIGLDVLAGLHAAHEAAFEDGAPIGIVHRDVSPANVIVGVDGIARVVDFGIAKAVGRVQTTIDGQLKGKIRYMAPEQLLDQEVTRQTDIWAVGVILWELITARKLFGGQNEGAIINRVLESPIRAPIEHNAMVPPELDAAVMQALGRDRDERFTTAAAMARALEQAQRPAPANRVAAWVQSRGGEELRARQALLASIETRSSAPVQSVALPTPQPLTSITKTAPVSTNPAPAGSRTWAVLSLGAVAMLIAGFAWLSPDAVRLESRAVVAPIIVADVPKEKPPVPPEASAPPRAASTIAAREAPAKAAKQCDPPYVRLPSGKLVVKRECL